jgi:hypothetical protein
MCFVLFVGTTRPMELRTPREGVRELSVEALSDRESAVAAHFSLPYVQYVGSTAGCGCSFPHSHDDTWFEDDETDEDEAFNRKALVELVRGSGESAVEIYGMWDGDFATPPLSRESVEAEDILNDKFHFRELGFYRVKC